MAEAERKQAPQNTFAKLFKFQQIGVGGTFTVLSVADDFRYELTFVNGKLKAITEKKTKEGSITGRTTECIDWYIQTWMVLEDGSMTLIAETYVGTTCDGDCWEARIVNGKNFRVNCSGGNGGSDIDEIYDLDVTVSISHTGNLSPNKIPVHWSCHTKLMVSRATKIILGVSNARPMPVPISQLYKDEYGHDAYECYWSEDWENKAKYTYVPGGAYGWIEFIAKTEFRYYLQETIIRSFDMRGASKVIPL